MSARSQEGLGQARHAAFPGFSAGPSLARAQDYQIGVDASLDEILETDET